ncbi:MAG: transporter substrate-binding domain-containing protein [Desulfobacteraceae bacterium]|nr:transporter substrate-binding domain-containing protein [Desulfobacteraceae bacterium]
MLTHEEMDFLKNNPKIKISNRVDWIPYDFAIAGRPAGFGVELMKLLFDKLNVEPEFVTVNSWNEILNMFYNNEIHIVHSLAKTKERQAKALFSKPYYFSRNVLIQRNSDRIVRDFDDLKGKIIALPRGWVYVSFMREKYPDIYILEVPNNAIAFEYVEKGKAFATLEQKAIADYLIKKFGFTDLIYSNGITDVELQSISSLHFAVLKKNMILMSILEKAFASINPEEISKIEKKWFGSGKSVEFLESIFLTREEDNYLEYRP